MDIDIYKPINTVDKVDKIIKENKSFMYKDLKNFEIIILQNIKKVKLQFYFKSIIDDYRKSKNQSLFKQVKISKDNQSPTKIEQNDTKSQGEVNKIEIVNFIDKCEKDKNIVLDDLIIKRIFFHHDFIEIIIILKEKLFFNQIWNLDKIEHSFYLKLITFINESSNLDEKSFFVFFKNFYSSESISDDDFTKFDRNDLILDKKITHYLINKIKKGDDFIEEYIVYAKIWNSFASYSIPFNNKKATEIYTIWSNAIWPDYYIENDVYCNFINKINLNFSELDLEFLPYYSLGKSPKYEFELNVEINRIKHKIIINKKTASINANNNYSQLIETLINSNDVDINNKIERLINSKIDIGELPEEDDIQSISKPEFAKYEIMKKKFIYNFYLYYL